MSIEKEHDFDFTTNICKNCGMTESRYQDRGEPECNGRKNPVKFGDHKIDKNKPLKATKYI